MTKILLVEDDTSLREIYGVRLLAEGYDIVSAGDGEQALAMAIKERPTLIITDIMMPKISGFDMLDILRSTTETKNIKVIMMSALGSEENKTRGERLGADRYLVKSQVGIEDVVHVVHEVLQDRPAGVPVPSAPAAAPVAAPAIPAPAPAALPPTPVTPPVEPPPPVAPSPTVPPPPFSNTGDASSDTSTTPPSRRARIIQPLNDPAKSRIDIPALLDREESKEGGGSASPSPVQSSAPTPVAPQSPFPPAMSTAVTPPRGTPSTPVIPNLPPVTAAAPATQSPAPAPPATPNATQ